MAWLTVIGIRRWLLILLLLAGGGVYLWQRPRAFTPYWNAALNNLRIFATAPSGFWCYDASSDLVFRTWQGGERWRVTPPTRQTGGWSPRLARRLSYQLALMSAEQISADGQYLALAQTADGPALRVQIWFHGSRQSDVTIPVHPEELLVPPGYSSESPRVVTLVMTERRVALMALLTKRGCRVFAIKDQSYAQGFLPYPAQDTDEPPHAGYRCRLCSLGTPLILERSGVFTIYGLFVRGTRIVFTPYDQVIGETRQLYANGTALTVNGELYQTYGPLPEVFDVSAVSAYGNYGAKYMPQRETTMVFATYVDAHWVTPPRRLSAGKGKTLFVADNGEYLVQYEPGRTPNWMTERASELRVLLGVSSTMPRAGQHTGGKLLLYQRPGRLRAVIPLDANGCWAYQGVPYLLHDWTLREDEQSLSVIASEAHPTGWWPTSFLLTWR